MDNRRAIMSALLRVSMIIFVHFLIVLKLKIRLESFAFENAIHLLQMYLLPILLLSVNAYLYSMTASRKRLMIWSAASIIPSALYLLTIQNNSTLSIDEEPPLLFAKYTLELGLLLPMLYFTVQFLLLFAWLSDWKVKKEGID
ncbi:hypothetical protein R70723_07610 [Paenibacillus sp. FSL R7-0273]|uniref:hypothetical protein n=1 Tax=Paenibacillus sp. FSL R7-0273 TaxID=1536772 RepID=UPI0004F7D815|nr:hypothetical protein [Paenibacillus sp. FSL R7-0273]AIQ45763.1 hypothetical protein R70723_07610 [Paenibacillus sp. FSL R7-0273]OMF95287.1 hypothetical protein BK144_07115 [Paenibacillus sp. FSL R7-0273]